MNFLQVVFHRVAVPESLVARATRVWVLIVVNAHVTRQISVIGELLGANFACVRNLTKVLDSNVVFQSLGDIENSSAFLAQVLPRVNAVPLVVKEILFRGKPVPAFFTNKVAFFSVNIFCVTVEGLESGGLVMTTLNMTVVGFAFAVHSPTVFLKLGLHLETLGAVRTLQVDGTLVVF